MQAPVTDVTSYSSLQQQALELLMSGESPCNTARILGIHRQTLWRWRQLPAFTEYEAKRRELRQCRHDEYRDQIHELLRLSMASVMRELKLAEDERMRNPLDTALKVLSSFGAAGLD